MQTLDTAILRTIAYGAIFSYPLTSHEVWTYLISDHVYTEDAVTSSLARLVHDGLLLEVDDWYLPPGRQSWIAQRRRRETVSGEKWRRGCRVANILTYIPSVRGIYLTGAVAMQNAEADDDIDLMIVTASDTLWTTRLVVTSLLHILGVRRRPDEHTVNDRLCTNMYLDESALCVPRKKRSLYTAHEVVQAAFVAGDAAVHQTFLNKNRWAADYLPNSLDVPNDRQLSTKRWRQLFSMPFVWVNKVAYRLQRWYMRKRMTRETVGLHMAYFHPRDTSALTLESYKRWCVKLGVARI